MTRGLALVLAVMSATTVVDASRPDAGERAAAGPRLKTISSRVSGRGASLMIEATDPVGYVATRPDPLTVVLDFRNVAAEGVANSVAANSKSPIAAVVVESAESLGAPASRVRVTLAQPVGHHVRSDRNLIFVDFDKVSGQGTPYVLPPPQSAKSIGAAPDAMLALAAAPAAVAPGVPPSAREPAILDRTGALLARMAPPQAPPQPPLLPLPQVQPPADQAAATRRFTGQPISLDFQGADLRAVLRTFAEISGLNIVIDPTVQGTVDVVLRDVPWDQALDVILRANKLGYLVDGTIIRIAPLNVLSEEEAQRRRLGDEQALAGELRVMTKTLSYAKAEEMVALLTRSALSQRGTVQVDPRTNTLIITDLAERLTTASDLIATLDRAQPQVEIEARIVATSRNYARALGVQWGFTGRVDPALGNTTNLAFPNSGTIGGRTGAVQGGGGNTPAQPTAVNLPAVGGATSAVGLALGSVNGAFNLDVALSALESSGNGRILSTPRVTTQNNVAAEMTQGTQIPIQTVANNTVTVQFKDAALTLKVTPQITAAGTVIMNIALENSAADFSRAVNGIPPIDTQRANTSVLVSDGQTTVIGGVYFSRQQISSDRTPGLGRVPLLKWLFKRDSTQDGSTELIIFITPRIIR